MAETGKWWLYMVRCCDGTLYTGVTTDVQRRQRQHNNGTGAKYTRSRRPVVLVYQEPCSDRTAALKREWQVKQLSRAEKLRLIQLQTENK